MSIQSTVVAVRRKALSVATRGSVVGAGLFVSASAFAEDTGRFSSAITSAITAAKADVTLTSSGVIGLAALMFGLGFIISMLRK